MNSCDLVNEATCIKHFQCSTRADVYVSFGGVMFYFIYVN